MSRLQLYPPLIFQAKQVTGGDSLAASVVSLHCAPSGFSEPLSFYIKSLSTEIRGFTSLDRFGRGKQKLHKYIGVFEWH